MQNYLLYRANTPDEINECSYSLLRYLAVYNVKPPADQRVVIYTNYPALLENYGAYFHHFDLKEVQELNTSRLALLRNFFREYEGNALYMDSNTYCTAPIETVFTDIAKGTAYVLSWNSESLIKSGQEKALKTIQIGDSILSFDPAELGKWNDSIIGLNSSCRNLLSDVVAQSQQQTVQLPLPLIEKWVFHHHLQQLNVRTADQFFMQYDDLKEFRNLLGKFFSRYHEESVPNQLKRIHHIDAMLIQKQKKEFQNLPLHQKLIRRIQGRHWSIEKYKV